MKTRKFHLFKSKLRLWQRTEVQNIAKAQVLPNHSCVVQRTAYHGGSFLDREGCRPVLAHARQVASHTYTISTAL